VRSVLSLLVLSALATGCAGTSRGAKEHHSAPGATGSPPAASPDVSAANVKRALPRTGEPSRPPASCPPLDEAKVRAPACDDAILTTPIPPIADEKHSLATFYEAYAALARGRANDHVRVAMYGDSNLTMDELTGRLRRQLQKRLGDAGHGFVALALPWHWYEHQDVHHHGQWDHFRQIATSTAPIGDQHYGMAMVGAESTRPGGSVWVATADSGSPIGSTASRFDVFFLKRPGGGDFDLLADGAILRSVSTRSNKTELGIEHVELPDAAHKLTCTVKSVAPVRFYGATLERGDPSLVVDSLGASALSFAQLKFTKPDTRRPMMERRSYKLVMFQVGTNTFALETHKEDVKAFLNELRGTLPGVSILLMTPPDVMGSWNDPHSDKRIVVVGNQLKEIAAETGSAFWDYREAMGGDTSIKTFIRKGLATADRIHLKKEGSELMADRFLCALEKDFRAWLAEHPDAGCGRLPEDTSRPR
jgi:hypothetical protein